MSWVPTAAEAVRGAMGPARHLPWARGLWLSAREHYAPTPLPEGFHVEVLALDGGRRRVAHREGTGRPLVVLPGFYAALDQQLFVRIVAAAAGLGRPVWLLEDRLAAPTVALACDGGLDPATLGRQLADLAGRLAAPPDVLALSGGLLAAWSAGDALHRVVGFSGVRAPAAVASALAHRPLVHAHFAACHAEAGLAVPFDALLARMAAAPALPPPPVPWLLVHADDDPVVDVSTLDDLPPDRVVRVPCGGHLAFGVLAGPEVYLLPLEGDHDR